MKTYSNDLPGALEWVRDEAERLEHGEITLTIKLHDNRVAFIERGTVVKSKPTGASGGQHDNRR